MLKGISSLVSPELLKVLSEMGHGDEIVFSDAHFPAKSLSSNILRLDGVNIPELLLGVLPLFELDSYDPAPLIMMSAVKGDSLDPKVKASYLKIIYKIYSRVALIKNIDRNIFYEMATKAFAIDVTGETAKYDNIILKKGVNLIL